MAQSEKPTDGKPGFLRDLFRSRYREATFSSIAFGLAFGVVMNMAITYAGLKLGFTIVGSTIAALVGFGVLRGLLRRGSILEVNIAQTVASAVNSATAGIIFTVPVVYLLHQAGQLRGDPMPAAQFWLVTLAGVVGGLLGVAFIIPLRKQMIDIERLRFPSGTAVGAILKSPGAGPKKSLVLLAGVAVGAAIYLPVGLPTVRVNGEPLPGYGSLGWRMAAPPAGEDGRLPRYADRDGDGRPDLLLTDEALDAGRLLGVPAEVLFVLAITPLSFGAGYLTGRAGLMVLAGGVLAFFFLNPIAYNLGWMPASLHPDQAPRFGYGGFNRPLGIGLLLGGAFMGVVAALPAIRAAFRGLGAARAAGRGADELGLGALLAVAVVGVGGLFFAADSLTADDTTRGLLSGLDPHLRNLLLAVIGAAWIWFAGIIIAQCTGMTDWSPVSGMALLTVVLVMYLAGTGEVVAAVLFGAALCVALSAAADMMADLKTGHIVGAQPRRQQVLELLGVLIGPLVTMLTLWLIVQKNMITSGVPLGPGTDTTAPQAQALQAVVTGVRGGDMPYALYAAGAVLGVCLGLGAFPGLGVLVGLSMYLPIEYVLTYGLGCLANMAVGRVKSKAWAEEWGVPFAAGLIVGEAMLAMAISLTVVGMSALR